MPRKKTHTLHVLGREGDRTLTWDPSNLKSVEKVREEFNNIIHANFAFSGTGKNATQIREFDPEAEEITMFRPIVGG